MGLIDEKGASNPAVARSGWSQLESLSDSVIEELKRRQYSVGQVIGDRFRLKALLGMGAMGQVFVAENMAIGIDVAVKLLKAELIANKVFRQRFQKEAEAISSVNHQNVARFLDLVVGDPTFLVMEYVQGPTLHQVIRQETRLAYARALNIGVRLCGVCRCPRARDRAPRPQAREHHPRDRSEIGEQPKIIDFGLAKLAAATEKADLTRAGEVVGTPEYMAPEQIEGKKVDARADVYSLGCVIYSMLVGHPPFVGDDDMQVLYKHLHEPPQLPSALVPGIPTKVDEVIARALTKDPAERYADTRELARALNMAHDRRRPVPRVDSGPIAKHAKPPIALIAATTLAVGAVGGVLLGRDRSASQPPVTIAAPVVERTEAAEMLIVTTQPSGATVELDGKALAETTPTAMRGVSIGDHTVKITRKDYGVVERTVAIGAGGRAVLDVTLPPMSRQVRVRTIPTGAAVFLENELVASTTPADISVQIDEFYALRVEKFGYEPFTKNLTPDDTEPEVELRLDEEKQPMGYLWIDTNGIGDVWIDGRATGFTAPTLGLRIPAGAHVVELRDSSGARSKPLNVKLAQGESQHVTLNISGQK